MFVHIKFWFWVGLLTILASLVVIFAVGPTWGIDFTGGSLLEVSAPPENLTPISDFLQAEAGLSATIQTTPDHSLIIRTQALDDTRHREIVEALTAQNLIEEELRFESVGPTIGEELRQKAAVAVVLVVVVLIIYLAYTFRGAAGFAAPWKFGVAAAYALIHDLLVVTAIFVVLGKLKGVPIDSLFVTAQLAIMGYSVNDTIILFDRLKTDWLRKRTADFSQAIDEATKATLFRSLNTSLTILVVLVALLLFGGTTIRWFVVALTAGTIFGSYSSIFIASPVLYYLAKRRR